MNEKDLVVLVADHNIEQALIGLFTRPEALGIREHFRSSATRSRLCYTRR